MIATGSLPPGWLLDSEGQALSDLAKERVVLEVGSWLGRSTVALARTAKLVVSIDHHRGSEEHRGEKPDFPGLADTITGEYSTLRRFLAHLEEYGVAEKVVPVVSDFERVAPYLQKHFDMAFIDAAHDYDSCLRHGRLALMVLREGAPLVFHDYGGFSGVIAAVDELTRRLKTSMRLIPGTGLAVLRG